MLSRRHALVLPLPLLAAACGGGDAPVTELPRIEGYSYLTPLRLNVASLDIQPPQPGADVRVSQPAPLNPVDEVLRMGRDRLSAVGSTGTARFSVETASLLRTRLGGGGLFSEPSERLDCVLRCQVEILDAGNRRVAFAQAEVRRTATMAEGGANTPAGNARQVVGKAMDDLNVEFEVQVRRNLRDWLQVTNPIVNEPPPGSIQREELPRGT
ncbi:hypothetical protein [Roseomonas elaeocarpi]|uniref:Lipoprotein n=1 Tax=Roseomonas elaeocarpi TaxID=907779 RepID=A0ABV6JRV7_9PROT